MSDRKQLPVLLAFGTAAVLFLGGCYTMLKHPPSADIAHRQDLGDCASCHEQGFSDPVFVDACEWCTDPWWPYYGTPWWIRGPDSSVARLVDGDHSRRIGSRGVSAGRISNPPPAVIPAPTTPVVTAPRPADAEVPADGELPPGKTRKKTREEGAESGDTPGSGSGKDTKPEENEPGKKGP